jgi:hypothetical protein
MPIARYLIITAIYLPGPCCWPKYRNRPLAFPRLRRRNEGYRFCDRYGIDPANTPAYRRAGSCAGDFFVSRHADILCGDRSNSVLGG